MLQSCAWDLSTLVHIGCLLLQELITNSSSLVPLQNLYELLGKDSPSLAKTS